MRAMISLVAISLSCVVAQGGSLSLEAHEIGTKDTFRSFWESDWGSYDRDYARGKRLLVTVRDFSRKIPECLISVYFIARQINAPDQRFIYHRKEFTVHFRGRIEVAGPVDAPDLRARIVNLAEYGTRFVKGADMDGWIVIGRVNEDQVFDVRASSQTLLEIAHENPRQAQTLNHLISDYEDILENGRH